MSPSDLLRQMAEGKLTEEQVRGMMGRLVENDPVLSQVLQVMQRQRQAAPVDPEPESSSATATRRARARARLEALLGELDELSRRMRRVARALGACECLGDEPDCERCHGSGAPGTFPIDRRLFAYLVQPAIDQQSNPMANSNPQMEVRQ